MDIIFNMKSKSRVFYSFIKNFHRFLQSRMFFLFIIFLIQFIIYFLLFYFVFIKNEYFHLLSSLLSSIMIIFIVNKYDHPSYKVFWIILILLLPLAGGITYLLFGGKKIPKKLRNDILKGNLLNSMVMKQDEEVLKKIESEKDLSIQFNFLKNLGNFPYHDNTAVEFFPIGEKFFEALISEIKKAKHFIFMEYFIVCKGFMLDRILEELRKKIVEGVEVYFLYDDGGCVMGLEYNFYKKLQDFGIKAACFNPVKLAFATKLNNRDHRKITVIDNNVAFIGGINISDEYINLKEVYGHWKDTAIMLKGKACHNCTNMFIQFFNASSKEDLNYQKFNLPCEKVLDDGFVLPFSDSPTDESLVGRSVHLSLIQRAKKYVYIHTPYLILDYELTNTLVNAVRQGVEVIITTPHIPDKKMVFLVTRYNYRELIKNGVKIYEYTPGFLHSKLFIVDDEIALLGTINMDYRSYYLHYECGVLFSNKKTIFDMKKDYLETLKISKQFTYEDFKNISFFKKILMVISNIFSPMF